MSAAAAIMLESVRAARGGRVVLDGVTLSVGVGERVALLGPNGVGKSTLLDVVLGLVPAEGSALVFGARPPARSVGFVGQDADASLMPWLSVQENVELPLRLYGASAAARARAFEEVRAWLDPAARLEPAREPRALSGGERQLVALMRAFIGSPRLVVLDEPLSAIDPVARARVRAALTIACERAPDTTLLFVTHDLADVVALAHRAVVLGGRPARVRADLWTEGARTDDVLRALVRAEAENAEGLRVSGDAPLAAFGSSGA